MHCKQTRKAGPRPSSCREWLESVPSAKLESLFPSSLLPSLSSYDHKRETSAIIISSGHPFPPPLTLTTSWQLIWRSGDGWCHDSRHLCPSKPAIWGAQSPSIVQNVPSGTVSLQQDWLWNWLHPVTVFITASKPRQSVREIWHHTHKNEQKSSQAKHKSKFQWHSFKVMICNGWHGQHVTNYRLSNFSEGLDNKWIQFAQGHQRQLAKSIIPVGTGKSKILKTSWKQYLSYWLNWQILYLPMQPIWLQILRRKCCLQLNVGKKNRAI